MVRILVRRFSGPGLKQGYAPLEIDNPADCRQLIRALVKSSLAVWNCGAGLGGGSTQDAENVIETAFSGPLTKFEIQAGTEAGGITFGRRHSLGLPEESEGTEAAETAFSNGLVRIFINDHEVRSIEANLSLQDGDRVCLIALSGLRSGFRW